MFPIRYIHGNLLFGQDHERAALYRVDTVSYPFLPDDAKIDWYNRLLAFAHAADTDFSIWRVCRRFPVAQYVTNGMGMLDPRGHRTEWRTFLEGHRARLTEMAAFVPEVYVAVSLVAPRKRSDVLSDITGRMRRRNRPPLSKGELGKLFQAEAGVLNRTANSLPVRRATTREIQWLLRRAACRGVCEPLIDNFWAPAALEHTRGTFEPLETDIWRHASPPLTEHDRYLVVEGEEIRTYQAMLTLGALPETAEFPGATEILCTPLEATPFPVDVAMHVHWMPNRDALKRVARHVLDADNAYAEQTRSAHGPLSYAVEENRVLVRDLDMDLRNPGHPPMLRATIGFAVGALTPHELDQRVEVLQRRFGQITLHRPLGLQRALFLDHLPRPDGGTVRDYHDYLTTKQFAAMMPVGTHETGSRTGAYFGHVSGGGRRPVLNDITAASREGRPPSILFIGSLGSGKTIGAEWLAYHAILRGSDVVDVDPKPDHNLEGIPGLRDRVRVIELSGDERYRGLLDPLMVAPPSLREDLTHAYLMDLLPQAPPTWDTQIRKAIKGTLKDSDPSCMAVLDALRISPDTDARAAGDALMVWSDSGIARLGFGTGHDDNTHHRTEQQVTTIKASALNLPGPEVPRADYDVSERVAVATLKLVAAFAMRLVTGDRTRHKLVLFDEAWFLLGSRSGRRLLDRLNRMGRTENATLVLVTQQIGDVGEIEGLIGTRLVFRQENDTEAKLALSLLGLDPGNRALVSRVRGYRAGRCLMRDVNDRIAELQIDVQPEYLLDIWDTTPGVAQKLVVA